MFNHTKYQRFDRFEFSARTWPSKHHEHAPQWCSVDLRDGNQALAEPMNVEQKLSLFHLLVKLGFKDIEIGFPSASQTDFDFTRRLITENLIPDDVCVQVLVQAREQLIERTFEALSGAKQAIVHVYNSTSKLQRERVFEKTQDEIITMAEQGARWVKHHCDQHPQTQWHLQYSPESFTQTEMPFALAVCNSVLEIWQPHANQRTIINLPATVEVTSANEFADQVEYIHQNLNFRRQVELSVHTHNDRGCAVSAAELAMLAGADRVEGTLYGNGERTGNMDIITAAMNFYSQGIDPKLDLSNTEEMAEIYLSCTQLPIHPRHPWVGDLVYTAYSGSHQDAIKKSMAKQDSEESWQVAYLPIDPNDLGRDYEAIIQVNSQSGKGGIAWVLKQNYGIELPKKMLQEFAKKVQTKADETGSPITAEDIWALLQEHYFAKGWHIDHLNLKNIYGQDQLTVHGRQANKTFVISEQGEGTLNTWLNALQAKHGKQIEVNKLHQYSRENGTNSEAIALLEATVDGETRYALGMDFDTAKAPLLAACGLF